MKFPFGIQPIFSDKKVRFRECTENGWLWKRCLWLEIWRHVWYILAKFGICWLSFEDFDFGQEQEDFDCGFQPILR